MSELLVVVPDAETEQEAEFFRDQLDRYRPQGIFSKVYVGPPNTESEWAERTTDADALILGWKIPDAALKSAFRLKIISFLGTGASDHINLDIAIKQNIDVFTVNGYADHAVAEHTFALLLGLSRNVVAHDTEMKTGAWKPTIGRQLHEKTIGLVGYGRIAKSVARIAKGFGMKVVSWSRRGVTDETIESVSLEELWKESDFVSLHLALTPETENFLSHDQLNLMKSDAFLINTARGGLIDESALLEALDSQTIAGAGLDVFKTEPVAQKHALSRHKRVIATPHIGFATKEADTELLHRGITSAINGLKKID